MSPASGVTDCHVHLLPGRLGAAVREFFAEHISGGLAYPNDHAAVLDALAAAGVTQAWHLPYAHKPGVAAWLNRASHELVDRWHGHAVEVVGGATVHPGDDDPAAVLAEALDELGLQVVKLHCSVGDFAVDDLRMEPVWRLVETRRVPTVVHAGRHVTGTTDPRELDALDRVAERFPGAPLVIAHAGHPATGRATELVMRHTDVYVDLTPRVTDVVGLTDEWMEAHADRVLFGSDAPNTQVTVEQNLARLDGLLPAAREAVGRGNAARLLAAGA